MTDLTFYGGSKGAVFGNQQFTVRNLKFCEWCSSACALTFLTSDR